ncbi:MAG: hypothetical protein AMS14_04285 [Planctomycetes bacterium DG_20]|nr:MAG: hypothetical protein AMS14_04285 [Planctomycetes bacterium DG_20]
MPRTLVINVAGLSRHLIDEVPSLAALGERGTCLDLEPVLPAVTCPMQATLVTGRPPSQHGIISSGLYFFDTAEVRFWEQSAHLVCAPRVWDLPISDLRSQISNFRSQISDLKSDISDRRPKTAVLFWQQSLYGSADTLLTPKPVHGPGGELIQDCYSRPADLYGRLAAGESALEPGRPRGPFNLMHYWGPMAGVEASRWIADASLAVWRDERPDLLLTYLPHLDYSGHRHGPGSDEHRAAARQLEPLVAPLIADADGARVIVLSEYSFLPVGRTVAPNRALREAGLVAIREVDGAEYLHPGDSRAFAMVDNQVAHIYFPRTEDLAADVRNVRRLLKGLGGVAEVLDRAALAERDLDHPRSGDLVALAEPDAHFVYYWWLDDAKAPPFAQTVDIHAKPGFDAAELFVEPATKAIPLSAERVRGSHGLVLDDGRGWGVFLACPAPEELAGRRSLRAAEVAHLMI